MMAATSGNMTNKKPSKVSFDMDDGILIETARATLENLSIHCVT
jgi:hypothetical protein